MQKQLVAIWVGWVVGEILIFARRLLKCSGRELGGHCSDVASEGTRRRHERQGELLPGLIAQNYRRLLQNEHSLLCLAERLRQ